MKRNIKFIYIGLLSFFIAGFYSCNEFEEFESIPANAPSTVEMSTGEVADSSIVVSVTNSSSGYVVAGIAESSSVEVGDDFDSEAFVKQNVEGYTFKKSINEGGEAVSFEFSELVQNTEYVIVAVGTNSDGVASEMVNVTVTTTDDFAPGLLETIPAASFDPVMTYSGALTVVFDEPVNFDDSKNITYSGFLSESDITDVNVEVSGSEVTITPADTLMPSDIVFVSWEEGTFTDLSGNSFSAMESGLDEESLPYGLYFGVEPYIYEPTSILPDSSNTVLPSVFDAITIEFADPILDLGNGEMELVYNHPNGDVTIKVVTEDLLTIDGNNLEISLPTAVAPGQTVELIAEEGVVFVGLGNSNLELLNPSAGMEIAWVVEHPLQLVLGDYLFAGLNDSDEAFEISIATTFVLDDATQIAIPLNQLIPGYGAPADEMVYGTVDLDQMEILFEVGQAFPDFNYGASKLSGFVGEAGDDAIADGEFISASIDEDGNITMLDWIGIEVTEGDNAGLFFNLYQEGSIMTKQ